MPLPILYCHLRLIAMTNNRNGNFVVRRIYEGFEDPPECFCNTIWDRRRGTGETSVLSYKKHFTNITVSINLLTSYRHLRDSWSKSHLSFPENTPRIDLVPQLSETIAKYSSWKTFLKAVLWCWRSCRAT